jgi:hypothetical protein
MAKPANGWLGLTAPIGVLLAIAAGSGLLVPGLYHGSPYFTTQAVAQDLVSLAVGLPFLIATAVRATCGSLRARLLWLGGLIYLVYTYAIAALEVRFNALFLVYVALLGCSLYALIGGLVTTDLPAVKASFSEKASVKPVSVYLGVLAILFYGLWLSEVIPALIAGATPQSVIDNGTPTNAVHVLDMAWVLPAMGIAAVALWLQRPLGYALAAALLSFVVLLALAILSMVLFLMRDGHPVVVPQVVVFAGLFMTSLGMLTWFMRSMQPGASLSRPDTL